MKKMLTFLFVALVAVSLVACKEEPADPEFFDGTGYGLVHGHYVGVVNTTIDEDGLVTELDVEEYFLPYSWAKVNASATASGYGLVHGHYVGQVDVTLDQTNTVTDVQVEEYFLPYNWAKVSAPRTAMGYGLVHGHYVGQVETTIDSTNTVTDISVEEYFLPYNWAKVTPEYTDVEETILNENILAVVGSRGTSYYSKYIMIDDVLFTGTVNGDAPAQSITYSADGIDNIEVWVQDEVNAKAYVEAVEAENFFIANADGSESNFVRSDASSNVSMKKSDSGYWSGVNYPLGWAGNIEAFETAVTGTKLDANLETIVKNVDGYWTIGDITTGATMTDFVDYYEVAQRAHTNSLTAYPEDVVTVTGSRGTSVYAKYIMVDDVLFTATVNGDAPAQSITYSADGIDNIEVWVQDEVNAKAYIDAVEAENFFIANADGSESSYVRTDASSNTSMKKSDSGYWSGVNYPLGWAGNIDAFETAVTGTKLNAALETIVKNTETGFWSIGDAVTGATMTDFVDYYEVAQRAYATALTAYGDDIVKVATSRGFSYYAKYIKVDGILFTATVNGEGTAQSVTYSATGIANIETWVEVEANAERYVQAIIDNDFSIANADGTLSAYTRVDATSNISMKKSDSGYWSGANYPLGWAGNMNAFATAVTGTKLDADLTSMVKDATTGFWSIGTVTTGATMTDFVDYYEVAQRAYAKAEAAANQK